jgi:uncharacterized membrane protein YuzA (DUF378 family)
MLKVVLKAVLILVCAIAAINWGLVTVFKLNAVELITPEGTVLRKVREPAYISIGIIGFILLLNIIGLIKL